MESFLKDSTSRTKTLKLRYPRIFSPKALPSGLEHGSGWDELVDRVAARISSIMEGAANGEIEVLQIKEKFGELRIYCRVEGLQGDTNAAIAGALKTAEHASTHICERCGQPGTLLRGRTLKTRCPRCASN